MALGMFSSQLFSATPTITNITASQRPDTKLVDITYDLADPEGDKCVVSIQMSSDSGETYRVPVETVSGHIGGNIEVGTARKIVWDAGADWDGEFSDKMKVKLDATDWSIINGHEFGDEVKPGGFLMGDGLTPEGLLNSKRINISHSYWLSKFEITMEQYLRFLNMKLAEGKIVMNGKEVRIKENHQIGGDSIQGGKYITSIDSNGDGHFWYREGKFIINGVNGVNENDDERNKKTPVRVSQWGAFFFAKTYGFELPTEPEWEKAARGPDHDDAGEHYKYPWSEDLGHFANGQGWRYGSEPGQLQRVDSQVPGVLASRFNTINGYGLYHVVGNAEEWTTSGHGSIKNYKNQFDLTDDGVNRIDSGGGIIIRGRNDSNFFHNQIPNRRQSNTDEKVGFRLIRRNLPN